MRVLVGFGIGWSHWRGRISWKIDEKLTLPLYYLARGQVRPPYFMYWPLQKYHRLQGVRTGRRHSEGGNCKEHKSGRLSLKRTPPNSRYHGAALGHAFFDYTTEHNHSRCFNTTPSPKSCDLPRVSAITRIHTSETQHSDVWNFPSRDGTHVHPVQCLHFLRRVLKLLLRRGGQCPRARPFLISEEFGRHFNSELYLAGLVVFDKWLELDLNTPCC